MPFRVGEALSGGGSVSMPPFRRFIRCGRLSRHLQLVAGCLGICNSWPPAPASAIPGRRPRYTRVVIPLGRVGPYRSVFAGSGGSVSVGPPGWQFSIGWSSPRRPPRLKKQQPPAAELFRAAVVVLFAGRAVRVRSRSTSCSSGQASCSSSCRRAWASSPPWHTPPGRWRSAAAGFRPAP